MVLKRFSVSKAGQEILGANIHQQISNPTRYEGLAINTCRIIGETEELFRRSEMTTSVLKLKPNA